MCDIMVTTTVINAIILALFTINVETFNFSGDLLQHPIEALQ